MPTIFTDRVRAELTELGARVRDLRARRGWTLDDLARRTDLSKSYLSRLEDGDRQASIAALLSLAAAFDVTLASFFAPDPAAASRCVVARAGDLPERQGNGLRYTPLTSAGRVSALQPIHVVVPAGRAGDEQYRHEGEEWLYVLQGGLRLTLLEETYDLAAGDAAHFDARLPHRLTAMGGRDAEIILVACAASAPLLESYR